MNMLIEHKEAISDQDVAIIAQYVEQSESEIEDETLAWIAKETNYDVWRLRT